MACSFCGELTTTIEYAKPANWTACSLCRNIIQAGNFQMLWNRMSISWIRRYPQDRKKQGISFVRRFNKKVLSTFMAARGFLPFD